MLVNKEHSNIPVHSPHDEHWSSRPRPVKLCSDFFSYYLELYKNKLKNLIRTSKFEFSFWVLCLQVTRVIMLTNDTSNIPIYK
jgi:alpha-galactosidase